MPKAVALRGRPARRHHAALRHVLSGAANVLLLHPLLPEPGAPLPGCRSQRCGGSGRRLGPHNCLLLSPTFLALCSGALTHRLLGPQWLVSEEKCTSVGSSFCGGCFVFFNFDKLDFSCETKTLCQLFANFGHFAQNLLKEFIKIESNALILLFCGIMCEWLPKAYTT